MLVAISFIYTYLTLHFDPMMFVTLDDCNVVLTPRGNLDRLVRYDEPPYDSKHGYTEPQDTQISARQSRAI